MVRAQRILQISSLLTHRGRLCQAALDALELGAPHPLVSLKLTRVQLKLSSPVAVKLGDRCEEKMISRRLAFARFRHRHKKN